MRYNFFKEIKATVTWIRINLIRGNGMNETLAPFIDIKSFI